MTPNITTVWWCLMPWSSMWNCIMIPHPPPTPIQKKISSGEGVPSAASFQRDTSRSVPWRWARRTRTAFRRRPSQPKSCVPGNAKPEFFVGFPGHVFCLKMCFFLTSQMHHTNIIQHHTHAKYRARPKATPLSGTVYRMANALSTWHILKKGELCRAMRHDQILHIITVLFFFSLSLWCVFAWPTPFTAIAKHATCYKNGTGCSMWRLGRWPTNGPENESYVVIKHHCIIQSKQSMWHVTCTIGPPVTHPSPPWRESCFCYSRCHEAVHVSERSHCFT